MADLRLERNLPPREGGKVTDDEYGANNNFQFAEGVGQITTLEEASSLLLLDELKAFAKQSKVQGKTKKELLEGFSRSFQTQTGLSWGFNNEGDGGTTRVSRHDYLARKILDCTGDCIRLASGPQHLFERVHLVYYRSTEWTEKSLTTIILAKMSRKNFPEYIVCRSSSIFPSRSVLLEFEFALRKQSEIDNILEFSGTPTTSMFERVKQIATEVYPRWRILVEQEQQKECDFYESGEGAYLRLFSPGLVYTRIIHKGLLPLARSKEHKTEYEMLSELLNQRLFHVAKRGMWYQRKALLEEHYMWCLMPFDGRSDEPQKKHWKRIAIRTCEEGLEDPGCHLIYHYELQKRITKLEKSLNVVKREQHDFGYAMLSKPEERIVRGIRIEREEEGGSPFIQNQNNTPVINSDKDKDKASKRGFPTLWLDEDGVGECRVESMCLAYYRNNGWKGYHSEGGIIRTLVSSLSHNSSDVAQAKVSRYIHKIVWLPIL